jgi:small subunit ribosomal protein S2
MTDKKIVDVIVGDNLDKIIVPTDVENLKTPKDENNLETQEVEKKDETTVKESMTLKDLISIEAIIDNSMYFGHKSQLCSPAMYEYIHSTQYGITIFDADKIKSMFLIAVEYMASMAEKGHKILFVGPSHKSSFCKLFIEQSAVNCGQPYMADGWISGFITNNYNVGNHISRLKQKEYQIQEGNENNLLNKKEKQKKRKQIEKRREVVKGIENITKLPTLIFSIGNYNAIIEAKKSNNNIIVVAVCDSNTPANIVDKVDYIIPGNDDSFRSQKYIIETASSWIAVGDARYKAKTPTVDRQSSIDGKAFVMRKKFDQGGYRPSRPFQSQGGDQGGFNRPHRPFQSQGGDQGSFNRPPRPFQSQGGFQGGYRPSRPFPSQDGYRTRPSQPQQQDTEQKPINTPQNSVN